MDIREQPFDSQMLSDNRSVAFGNRTIEAEPRQGASTLFDALGAGIACRYACFPF
jgi:hypothetical protein